MLHLAETHPTLLDEIARQLACIREVRARHWLIFPRKGLREATLHRWAQASGIASHSQEVELKELIEQASGGGSARFDVERLRWTIAAALPDLQDRPEFPLPREASLSPLDATVLASATQLARVIHETLLCRTGDRIWPEGSFLAALTNRVNMENGTGKPEYAYFLTNYNANKSIYKDYIVLQGHPKFWTSVQLNEFSQIIDFLIAEGCEFQLPYEYYLSLNPLTPHPTKTQAITFPALLNKNIEGPDFIPEASSSSNLPVSFNSSNATVATIMNGNIHLVGEGTTVITASQIGDETYKSADYVSKTLTVSKKAIQLDPNKLQGLNFDLKDWKLQTISPTNTSTDIGAASLVAGYSSSFFYRNASDGSIVFKVPSNGGTTNNSTYPRCELRQMGAGANWALDDPSEHYLFAECKVIQVANAKPQIIIGQIHGSETNSELIKLRWTGYEAGKCYVEARFENNDATKSEYGVKLATGLSLGDLVTYTITMKSGKITVTVNGSSASQTYTSAYFGTTDAYYFKAGNYLQYNNLTNPTLVYGQTQFYKLSLDKTLGTTNFDLSNLKYYPNPVESILTLNYANLITVIQVYNTAGQSVLKTFPNTKDPQIDISYLTKGIYYVEVLSDEKREIIKVIKK